MSEAETRRLYVGGLFEGVTPEELRQRLSPFGNVHDVDIKVRKDDDGVPIKTFAYVNMALTDKSYKQCLQTYNKSRWKGSELYLQVAKESFLDRLKREREEAQRKKEEEEEKEKLQEIEKEKSRTAKVPPSLPAGQSAVPGTPLDGVKDWVVGKYGRVLPVVHIRRKDKKKVITVDPSKFCHGIKKLTAEEAATDLDSLTWTMEEKPNPHQQAIKHKHHGSSDSESSSGGSKQAKKVKLDKSHVRSKMQSNSKITINGTQPHQNTNGGYNSDSESDGSADEGTSRYTKLHNRTQNQVSSLASDSQGDFEVVSISAAQRNTGGEDSAGSADTDEIISFSKSPASKKDISSSSHTKKNASNSLNQKKTSHLNGNESVNKNTASEDKSPKRKLLSKKVLKNSNKSSSSSSEGSDSDAPSVKDNKSKKEVLRGSPKVPPPPVSEDSDSDSANELYQKSLELLLKAQEKMKKKRKGEALPLDTFKAVGDMLQKKAEGQPKTQSKKKILKKSPTKSSSDSDSDSEMDISISKKKQVREPKVGNGSSSAKDPAGSHSSSSDSDSDEPVASTVVGCHGSGSSLNRTSSTGVVQDQGADSSDSDTPMDIINRTKKKISNTPSGRDTAPESDQKLSNSTQVEKTKNKKEHKVSSKLSSVDTVNVSSDTKDIKVKQTLEKSLPHEYHSSSSDSEDDTKSGDKSKKLTVKDNLTRPAVVSKSSPAKVQQSVVTSLSEYSSGLNTAAEKDSSSEDEEEDLLDLVASGKQAALKKMVSALEHSPADTKRASLGSKSSTQSSRAASSSEQKKSSQKPSSETEPEDKSKKKIKKAKAAKTEEAGAAGPSEKKEKNQTKQAKHEQSNQKRLDSLKERKKEISSQQSIIKNALANVDSAKSKSKITFDSDDEDDAIAAIETESSQKDKDSQGLRLFDSDASSGDEDQEHAEHEFRMRPEKEGKAGAKLQRLQNRYGNDDRFKLSADFLDSEESDAGSEKEMAMDETDETKPEISDRERSLRILQSVVGNQAVVTKKQQNRDTFRNVGSLHYDPSKEDHQQFEIIPEPKTKKKKVAADKAQSQEAQPEEPLPEVSKEKFFNVATDLKSAFQKDGPASGGFSFTSLFGGEVSETSQATGPVRGVQPLEAKASVNPWGEERFAYDSSDEEEGQAMDTQEHTSEPKKPVPEERKNTFFFTQDDPRIKEGLAQFCRQEDMETIRTRWEERRPDLVESFRMQRKRALRNAHNSNNARSAPGKFNSRSTPSKRGRQR